MLCHVIMGNFRNHLCTIKTRTAMPNNLNVSYPLESPVFQDLILNPCKRLTKR